MMHFLFYCVMPYCTAMMILQCIYTHCNLKVIDTVLIAIGILYLSRLLKLSILFAHFLHGNDNQFLFEFHHEKTCLGVSDQV